MLPYPHSCRERSMRSTEGELIPPNVDNRKRLSSDRNVRLCKPSLSYEKRLSRQTLPITKISAPKETHLEKCLFKGCYAFHSSCHLCSARNSYRLGIDMALSARSVDCSLDRLDCARDAQTNSLCYKISTINGLYSEPVLK